MHARRRNGKLASCEPCRKRKISCDHRKPTCSRCEQRGQSARCVYHPAPLTRPADARPTAELRSITASTKTVLPRNDEHDTRSGAPTLEPATDSLVEQVKVLLQQLRHFDLIEEAVRNYYATSQGAVVPGAVVLPIFESLTLSPTLRQAFNSPLMDYGQLYSAANSIISATRCAVDVSPSTTFSSFCYSLSGESPRLEALGILFSVAARQCKLATRKDDSSKDDLIQEMYWSSLECRRIARDIAPMNDALLWLTYENVILTSYIYSDYSDFVWQRHDSLCGDVFALGIHRDAFNTTNTPTFIAQLRRRTYHKTYGLDVFLAAVFDRPPRLSKRHSDCPLPLDLADNEVCADDSRLNDAISRLSSDGWNAAGTTDSSTWIRTRSLFSSVKEEIAECSFLLPSAESLSRLSMLSVRLHAIWGALPAHVRNIPTHWTPDTDAFLMLSVTRLKFLQSDLHIHSIMKQHGESDKVWEPLLSAAAETIALLTQIGNARDRTPIIGHEFRDIVIGYGLASAGIIATSLREMASNPARRLPATLSRATLIKNLLSFVSHLESFMGDPSGSYSNMFANAAKALSHAIDRFLEPSPAVNTNSPAQLTPSSFSGGDGTAVSRAQLQSTEDAEQMQPDMYSAIALDDMDLTTWINSLEWTGISGNWIDL